MTLRVVQPGLGASRPLVAMFLMWEGLDVKIRQAFGPGPCIIADNSAKGAESMAELIEFAHIHAGLEQVSAIALVGYSAGCQRVRALRIAGTEATAYLLADGTHASWPPQDWQIAWLRELAEEARAGRVLLVASHTWQTYTERLTPPATPFASTLTVLRMATGFLLEKGGPPEAPEVSQDGALWVYSYATPESDARAHSYQAMVVLPKLAGIHVGPWLAGGSEAPPSSRPRVQAQGSQQDESRRAGGAPLVLGGLLLLSQFLKL